MRTTLLLLVFSAAVAALPSHLAGQASGGSAGSVATTRRCPNCAARDSVRLHREKLLLKIDSLRWEFDHGRMSSEERARLSQEMTQTVVALQESLDESSRARAVAAAIGRGESGEREAMRMAPRAQAFTIQTYRSRGYLGVTFDGPNVEFDRDNEHVIRFIQYPRIALVEPSSPAERAGVVEGDTLLALNGADVRAQEISLTKLLVPDSKILLRVRREGSQKDLRVTVGEAPQYYVSRVSPRAPRPPMPEGPPPPLMPSAPEPMRIEVGRRLPTPPVAPTPMSTIPGQVWVFSEGIGGAKVETISEGLGKAFGVKSGVLVLRVTPGTPAHRSGLRDGDVIRRAAGRNINGVRELRAVLEEIDAEEGVKLLIRREGKEREVMLRW